MTSVEIGRVRELLTSDRRLAGQARAAQTYAPLHAVDYQMPLSVRLRRRWRRDRRLRLRSLSCGLLVVLASALSLWLVHAAPNRSPSAARAANMARAPQQSGAEATPIIPDRAPAAELASDPQPITTGQAINVGGESLSARRRLQRADVWLRLATPRAANEARSLLEGALAELAGSVHGQVALARTCLRLGDEICARTAIHKAVLARPGRTKYRTLARQIDRAFALRQATPAAP